MKGNIEPSVFLEFPVHTCLRIIYKLMILWSRTNRWGSRGVASGKEVHINKEKKCYCLFYPLSSTIRSLFKVLTNVTERKLKKSMKNNS